MKKMKLNDIVKNIRKKDREKWKLIEKIDTKKLCLEGDFTIRLQNDIEKSKLKRISFKTLCFVNLNENVFKIGIRNYSKKSQRELRKFITKLKIKQIKKLI